MNMVFGRSLIGSICSKNSRSAASGVRLITVRPQSDLWKRSEMLSVSLDAKNREVLVKVWLVEVAYLNLS